VGKILGLYIPSQKNKLVSGLFQRMGYEKKDPRGNGDRWELKVSDKSKHKKHHIEIVENS
jgi:predicted enzyme involved in methoxymalonyl-ACP biosynthesis